MFLLPLILKDRNLNHFHLIIYIEHSKAVTTVSPNRQNSRENNKMFHYSLKILYYNSETKAAKAVELKNLLLHLEV